jgi:hypothetical protein
MAHSRVSGVATGVGNGYQHDSESPLLEELGISASPTPQHKVETVEQVIVVNRASSYVEVDRNQY